MSMSVTEKDREKAREIMNAIASYSFITYDSLIGVGAVKAGIVSIAQAISDQHEKDAQIAIEKFKCGEGRQ